MSLSEYDRTAPDDPQNKPAEEKEPVFDDDSPMKKSGLIFGGRTACGVDAGGVDRRSEISHADSFPNQRIHDIL